MARSLRSNRVQKNKVLKRRAYFGDVAKAREERIAERLHGSLDKAMTTAAPAEPATEEADMSVEGAAESPAPKKISTAGWTNKNKHKRRRHLKTSKQMSRRRK